jgi:hypothetical protein
MWWTNGAGVMGLFGPSLGSGVDTVTRAKITFSHQHHTRLLPESRCDPVNYEEKSFTPMGKFCNVARCSCEHRIR